MKRDLKKAIQLINTVNTQLQIKCFLISQRSFLLSLSAGQDSICMLFVIKQLETQWNCLSGSFSCNHLWQRDSFYTLSHIKRLSFLISTSLSFAAPSYKLRTEEQGRRWRHNNLQRIAFFYHYKTIATGHTASDRAETILFNFLRGTGKRGLCSLTWNKFVESCYPQQYGVSNFAGTSCLYKSYFFRLLGS